MPGSRPPPHVGCQNIAECPGAQPPQTWSSQNNEIHSFAANPSCLEPRRSSHLPRGKTNLAAGSDSMGRRAAYEIVI